MTESPILVLGATGKTGRRVVTRLRDLGLPVKAASRSGETRFDWDDPTTWDAALDGVSKLYLVPPPLSADPTQEITALLQKFSGHVVVLSARGAGFHPAEDVVRKLAAEWTVLRPTWFFQNFNEDLFAPAVEAGELALPAGDGSEPFIDADDIADVAVAALTQDGHAGQTYDLSGPESLTWAEAAAHIERALGRPFAYRACPPEEFHASLTAAGVPEDLTELLVQSMLEIAGGESAYLSDGVQRALGRPPRSFTDFVTATWPSA
ncbi:SDR family oxidoreductase [Sinosporangium siamense]|uniref:NmrA family protein n=1 Tax=Sinosporangium siamense TaxID=1367973 RepID=A0A919RLS3_9ACTN|nr:SDR family oxidoreductase [Sinosporangium siamense]GII95918.1 NmrA family protein [Sinosporangium siamense]